MLRNILCGCEQKWKAELLEIAQMVGNYHISGGVIGEGVIKMGNLLDSMKLS